MFDLTSEEREYLIETLEAAQTQLLHELHHADRMQYRQFLRGRIAVNEQLREKLEPDFAERAS